MNYQDIRDEIHSGDVIAFRGRGFVGNLIRVLTRSEWSHVARVVKKNGRLLIFEALEFHGVITRPLSDVGDFALLRQSEFVKRNTQRVHTEAVIWRYLGKYPYSYANAIKSLFGMRMSRGGKMCSQLVMDIELNMDQNDVPAPTPSNVVVALLKRGYSLTYINNNRHNYE